MTAPSSFVCRELRLRRFRNFTELELVFPPEGVAIIGDNGSGKTNLVEALFYLEIFRSFRGASDSQLVQFGEDVFHVRGRFGGEAGEQREITAAYERRTGRKRVTVNGTEPERIGDAIGRIGAVVFSPSDVEIIAGAPGERRRFLDIVLSLNAPGYLTALQRYRQVLKQRNAMLKDGATPALLAAWDEGLAESGGRIIAARAAWVAARADAFHDRYAAVGGGAGARLEYRSSVPLPEGAAPTAAEAADAFRAELERTAERERDRGMTVTGPHRDDIGFVMLGRERELDLRDFGSGGQQRTAAVALRLIEAETVREARGREPLLLLDDVFAELDPGRSRRILELIDEREPGQVIVTAPKPSDVEVRRGTLPEWRIEEGKVFT